MTSELALMMMKMAMITCCTLMGQNPMRVLLVDSHFQVRRLRPRQGDLLGESRAGTKLRVVWLPSPWHQALLQTCGPLPVTTPGALPR